MKDSDTTKLIKSLPKDPNGQIFWIVYNSDLVNQAKDNIAEIKGQDYLEHVNVVAMDKMKISYPDIPYYNLYYDPSVYKLLGNGLN